MYIIWYVDDLKIFYTNKMHNRTKFFTQQYIPDFFAEIQLKTSHRTRYINRSQKNSKS